MTIVMREITGFLPPSNNFALYEQRQERSYILYDDEEDSASSTEDLRMALYANIIQFLGGTYPYSLSLGSFPPKGKMTRVSPASDPVFPSLFAENVSVSVNSNELYDAQSAVWPLVQVPSALGFAEYRGYVLTVRYGSCQGFAILTDANR